MPLLSDTTEEARKESFVAFVCFCSTQSALFAPLARAGSLSGCESTSTSRWAVVRGSGCTRRAVSDTEVPAHHNAEAYVDAYLEAAGIGDDKRGPLFRTTRGRSGILTRNRMPERCLAIDLPSRSGGGPRRTRLLPVRFKRPAPRRIWGNGRTIENPSIAAHESPRTTKLDDRTDDELTLDETERIAI